jgi:hypothetical protein
MGAVNRVVSSILDVALVPFEFMGAELTLVIVSAVFGILAIFAFKYLSWQRGIKGTKDRIKGHLIAVRIYQDDLGTVFSSVVKVLLRNVQYLVLNLVPFVPLSIPFALIVAQLVVRYAFAPLPVAHTEAALAKELPGRGTLLEIHMKAGRESEVSRLEVRLPEGLRARSPLVRNSAEGVAFLEIAAVSALRGSIDCAIDGRSVGTKEVVAGRDPTRSMQPERVSGFWSSWLWPAEPPFPADSPLDVVRFTYPDRELFLLPEGPGGILLTFFLASLVFGFAALKPLGVQI